MNAYCSKGGSLPIWRATLVNMAAGPTKNNSIVPYLFFHCYSPIVDYWRKRYQNGLPSESFCGKGFFLIFAKIFSNG
jgi:hypothetical protein